MTIHRAMKIIAIMAIVTVAENHFGYVVWEGIVTSACVGFLL